MWTRLVNAFVKRSVRSFERVAAEAAQDIGGVYQRLGCQQCQDTQCQHGLRAIYQGDRLLGLEHQWLDLRAPQGVGTGDTRALFIEALALANQSQSQVRQGRQITARSHASLRRYNRNDA